MRVSLTPANGLFGSPDLPPSPYDNGPRLKSRTGAFVMPARRRVTRGQGPVRPN